MVNHKTWIGHNSLNHSYIHSGIVNVVVYSSSYSLILFPVSPTMYQATIFCCVIRYGIHEFSPAYISVSVQCIMSVRGSLASSQTYPVISYISSLLLRHQPLETRLFILLLLNDWIIFKSFRMMTCGILKQKHDHDWLFYDTQGRCMIRFL